MSSLLISLPKAFFFSVTLFLISSIPSLFSYFPIFLLTLLTWSLIYRVEPLLFIVVLNSQSDNPNTTVIPGSDTSSVPSNCLFLLSACFINWIDNFKRHFDNHTHNMALNQNCSRWSTWKLPEERKISWWGKVLSLTGKFVIYKLLI